jgi:hypothetical protein
MHLHNAVPQWHSVGIKQNKGNQVKQTLQFYNPVQIAEKNPHIESELMQPIISPNAKISDETEEQATQQRTLSSVMTWATASLSAALRMAFLSSAKSSFSTASSSWNCGVGANRSDHSTGSRLAGR